MLRWLPVGAGVVEVGKVAVAVEEVGMAGVARGADTRARPLSLFSDVECDAMRCDAMRFCRCNPVDTQRWQ